MTDPHDKPEDKVLKSARTFLGRWQPATAELSELTRSHRTLKILLTRDDRPGSLLLSCIGPLRIAGLIRWADAIITVTRAVTPDGEPAFLVADPGHGLEVLCENLELRELVKPHD
jgi:hypothetical protein